MLVCNLWTDLVADDYRYFFSYADESRIERRGYFSHQWPRTGT